jgi:hypothetical protein
MGLGLAVGAGYVLGRTKKAKMALAVAGLVAGKRLPVSPRAVADLVNRQLKENPQFKEIGDTLRSDLRGVGKAASGALVERQIGALADRLHSRTGQVREQLSGDSRGRPDDEDTGDEDTGGRDAAAEEVEGDEPAESADRDGSEERRAPAKKSAPAKKAAGKAPAKKAAGKAPAAAAKKTASARKTAAKEVGRSRQPKGDGER